MTFPDAIAWCAIGYLIIWFVLVTRAFGQAANDPLRTLIIESSIRKRVGPNLLLLIVAILWLIFG